jgi:hypothetical protein
MMVVRAMPVTSWIWGKLIPAAAAARITSSRLALASAQARSSVSTSCVEYSRPRPALLTGAARRMRGGAGRAGPRGDRKSSERRGCPRAIVNRQAAGLAGLRCIR